MNPERNNADAVLSLNTTGNRPSTRSQAIAASVIPTSKTEKKHPLIMKALKLVILFASLRSEMFEVLKAQKIAIKNKKR